MILKFRNDQKSIQGGDNRNTLIEAEKNHLIYCWSNKTLQGMGKTYPPPINNFMGERRFKCEKY